jgi:hypothetical protein
MLPVRIKWRDPKGLASADSPGVCYCDDGTEYVLKDGSGVPHEMHNEWFCTNLAEAVGIACPPCKIVLEEDDNPLFGSRWEGGIPRDNWWEVAQRDDTLLSETCATLSRILAFDFFVNNVDRHNNNYIFRESRNSYVLLAMDFGRSWQFDGFPLKPPPMGKNENTRECINFFRNRFGDYVNLVEVNIVLDRILSLNAGEIGYIIQQQPEGWLPTDLKDAQLTWWDSKARLNRIDAIRKGIADGTFL